MKKVKKVKIGIRNFFDYPYREKKQIIIAAAKGANELQRDLIAKYNLISG